jgi:hypothetical protein
VKQVSRVSTRIAALAGTTLLVAGSVTALPAQASNGPRVLLVGTYHGVHGQYATIQAAVDAARPGDWVLVAPGDYHAAGAPDAGVLITTNGIHLRGLDRNTTIVDGTQPGARSCDSAAGSQVVGGVGRNGVEVLKANGVTVENLTVCNFLSGTSGNGNEVWFNGGDGSGTIGMRSYHGAYLTGSTSYFDAAAPGAAMYGVFVSNASGPGVIEQAYASNMADSSFYVGACADCRTVLRFVHAENSALGYSGSNSGGHLVIESSEWDLNRAGIVPNSLANEDPPSPQNGACPASPSRSCTIITGNWVHDNNNPNTPAIGLTAGSPVGTGIEISGGQNDTVTRNLVTGQGAWGVLLNDYPDPSPPSVPTYCAGGIPGVPNPFGPGTVCYFVAFGNRISDNLLIGNGTFANPTNGDLADASIPYPVDNCFSGNRDIPAGAPSSDPANIQKRSVLGTCGVPGAGDTGMLFDQVACAALGICPAGGTYPQPTAVRLMPIPGRLPTMPDPCDGVPENPFCD